MASVYRLALTTVKVDRDHLADEMWRSIDWVNRQSSLNGLTGRIDSDGKLRIVICSCDPGVPNWLDTVDRQRGLIYGRWTGCNTAPTPAIIKINLADLRRHLPDDTPIVDKAARESAIRLRRKGWQMRKRW